ncbi:DUF6426 family protein [Kitasatospora sp. NPDC002227]|uniref:DUF6426 family protein n=1 Tax=Kitasatospora sp. NPDC002227 TaxID=3154773 RepID=UPI0033267F29
MDLKKFVVAAALGASVLTAVPALVAPHEAAASSCSSDAMSDCGDPGDGGGDPGGDDSGGDLGGGEVGGGDLGGGVGGGDMAGSDLGFLDGIDGEVGDYVAGTDNRVEIKGKRPEPPITPPVPQFPPSSGISDGSTTGGGIFGGQTARVWSSGQKWRQRLTNCLRNDGVVDMKYSHGASYQWSIKASTNLTVEAEKVLKASLGTEINTTFTENYNAEVTLKPGQTWALEMEYQTVVYQIVQTDWFGHYTTEYANVTMPTSNVTAVSC